MATSNRSPQPGESPILSVIVPYDGTPTLGLVLESLALQDFDWARAELIVVTRTESAAVGLMRPYRDLIPSTIVAAPSLSQTAHAAGPLRNFGAQVAKSPRLAFLDSDCIAGPEFVSHHARATSVTMGTLREIPADKQERLAFSGHREFEALWRASLADYRNKKSQAGTVPARWSDCYSGNVSMPRTLFEEVGGFDDTGHRCHDMDLGYRLGALGASFTLDFDCRVVHVEHPRTLGYRLEQQRGWELMASRHAELESYAEQRAVDGFAGLRRVYRTARKHFDRLVGPGVGTRCGTVFVQRPGAETTAIMRSIASVPHIWTDHATAREARLRLHRDCWDFSVMIPNVALTEKPRWTIVIPAFNAAATLWRAVESALSQTRQDLEVVIVDDGSTDGTARVAAGYAADGRIRTFSHPRNQGLAAAMNHGLLRARGEYLLQLDADDWLSRPCLERLDEALAGGAVAAYGRARIHLPGGRITESASFAVQDPRGHYEYPYVQAPRAYDLRALRAVGGWPEGDPYDGRYYEDRRMLARLHSLGQVVECPDAIYNVMERADSLARGTPRQARAAKLVALCQAACDEGTLASWSVEDEHLRGSVRTVASSPRRTWSVIIPHKDQGELLRYSIRSWAESDLPPEAEIIVVDDASRNPPDISLEALDPRVRVVSLRDERGAGAARNFGARLARGELLLFSDSDQIVPRHVVAGHERAHATSNDALVCASVFARRTATVVPIDLPRSRRARLAYLWRTLPEFEQLASALLGDEAFHTFAPTERIWSTAARFSFHDKWAREWAHILLAHGEEIQSHDAAWLKVASSSMSMVRVTFEALRGFDATFEAMEDWELGIRAQQAGLRIVLAPSVEPLHQLHPVSPDRRTRDAAAHAMLREKHPGTVARLGELPRAARPPGSALVLEGPSTEGSDETKQAPGRVVALTFDDGPHPIGTRRLLDVLGRRGGFATFFQLGANIQQHPDLCREAAAAGHEIGVHGWLHTHPRFVSADEQVDGIRRCLELVERVAGTRPKWFRPPYGLLTRSMAEACALMNLKIAGWSVSATDWCGMPTESIISQLAVEPLLGKVVLLHDGSGDPSSTAAAVDFVLRSMRGVAACTLSELEKSESVPGIQVVRAAPRVPDGTLSDLIATGWLS